MADTTKNKAIWRDRINGGSGQILDNKEKKVFLSYQPNDTFMREPTIDSSNPETAIVIINGKGEGMHRYLIYRGDWRKELAELYPDVEKLKEHWRENGGHFWSDSLEELTDEQ